VVRVLALDVGSSSVRAQVFDEHGEPVDELRQEVYGGDDPDEIVHLVREAIGGREADLTATSCFGHSLVALDARGRPLTPVLGWRDTRSAEAAERLRGRVDPAAVHARTGQFVHSAFWPAKLLWLAETGPEIFRGAARFVSCADYLYAELIGAVPAASPLRKADEVDRDGTRIMVAIRSAYDLYLSRNLKQAQLVRAPSPAGLPIFLPGKSLIPVIPELFSQYMPCGEFA